MIWVVGVERGTWEDMAQTNRDSWQELADEIEVFCWATEPGGNKPPAKLAAGLFASDNVSPVFVGGFQYLSNALVLVYNHLFQEGMTRVSLITHRNQTPFDYNTALDRNNRDDVFASKVIADCGVEFTASCRSTSVVGTAHLVQYVRSLFRMKV